ncbi:MAG: LPS-assembly protein LptD [Gammaproteobacteria bacterium]
MDSNSYGTSQSPLQSKTQDQAAIIQDLGWISSNENRCGGYYIEAPIAYPKTLLKTNSIQITSDQLLFAQHGTSVGEGKVTITRYGQQIVANKAYLYRDPKTGELSAIDLTDHVILREPNSLVSASKGRYVIKTKAESLQDLLYRTTIYSDPHYKPPLPSNEALQNERKVTQLSAWGEAKEFSQNEPKIYEFEQASYSTCPPTSVAWKVKTSHLTLNKETGRGAATNVRLLVRGIPVFYSPYLNFPIDKRRKTGFLWPTYGGNSLSGPIFSAPFYWNIAPNYDSTITPSYLSKRGLQLRDLFRYLTPTSKGQLMGEILPADRDFTAFKIAKIGEFESSTNPIKQGQLNRLENASTTRGSFRWIDTTRFNEHWSGDVNYNWVSDDYYLRDFSNTNINQTTQNQLLQQGEINYKGQNWNFTSRIQGYQTLHPIDENVQFINQYTRLPQFVVSADYPDMPLGLEYFADNDFSHFALAKNPGLSFKFPIGNRINIQPGISRPITWPFLTLIPRLQYAMTKYEIGDVNNINPKNPSRMLPIFDLNSELYFERHASLFKKYYRQTLEPRFYYTYIPFRDQNQLPIFDTTVNTLTYDQLFMYNRFSGLDRINDANQIAVGLTTRLIEGQSGTEKAKAAIGQIVYFRRRSVTLCSGLDPICAGELPGAEANRVNRSPLTGLLSYNVSKDWSVTANSIWNAKTDTLDNQSISLHYQPTTDAQKIINLGYNYVRGGDLFPTEKAGSSAGNLSSTDLAFNWPIFRDWGMVGRWTQNWNHHHFQNLLYGLQYDSCCWAVRAVAGRVFTGLGPSNTFQYNTQVYIQVALKGLGNIGKGGDPSQLLGGVYQTNFGRDF